MAKGLLVAFFAILALPVVAFFAIATGPVLGVLALIVAVSAPWLLLAGGVTHRAGRRHG